MRAKILALAGAVLVLPFWAAVALPINTVNQLVVFGDSLSDTGNASILSLGVLPGDNYAYRSVPGLPYSIGEYTNGPVPGGPAGLWVEQFAAKIGQPSPQPYLLPGQAGMDYAVASADTGSNGAFFVSDQVGIYLSNLGSRSANPTALYTFWAGANDIADGKNPVTAADNLYANILALSNRGAKYFVWMNLPDLGKTPEGIASGQAAAATAASNAFNAEWSANMSKLQALGIDVIGVNIGNLFSQLLADPAAYGFANVTTPGMSVPGANPNQFVFWDGHHPTTAANALVADAAFDAFTAAPEPASITLTILGLGSVLLALKLRRRSAVPARAKKNS